MNEYTIIESMKMLGKSVVVLDKERELDDSDKSKVIINGKEYSFSLTHNKLSIIIDTQDNLVGKTMHFE